MKLRPKRKIIISVHGIRTTGAWQKQIASVISENGWIYYPLDYGYFTSLHFALPPVRWSKINWFREQFDQVKQRYSDVVPSVIAHSNGTYIVANALRKFPEIKLDKLILCGGIVRPDFDWPSIFKNRQATLVRNEIGGKDIWAKHAHWLAWGDTGPSGQSGFLVKHPRLKEETFHQYDHGSFQAFGHYRTFWLPFLDEPMPYEGETDPPWYAEEPVSPYDAARWSAMTYFHQYVARVHNAIANGEAFAAGSETALPAKRLWVIVPKTPGQAAKDALKPFFQNRGLQGGLAGKIKGDQRSFQYKKGEILYDIPTTLNTLGFLDNRKDEELIDAVEEFSKWLKRLVKSPRSQCAETVEVKEMNELPAELV